MEELKKDQFSYRADCDISLIMDSEKKYIIHAHSKTAIRIETRETLIFDSDGLGWARIDLVFSFLYNF